MAEGIAFSFLGKISEYLVAPIGRQFGYVFRYNGNIKEMTRKVEELDAKSGGVKLLVAAGNNNLEVVGPDVELWLKNVDEKMKEANSILSEKEKVGKGCLNEWCLHIKSRYSVSRKASKRTQDLADLIAAGNFPRVTYPGPALGKVPKSSEDKKKTQHADEVQEDGPLAPDLTVASTSSTSSGGLESRLVIMRNVMEAIRDDKIRTLGICGMGGVGKTTLVHEVDRIVREERLFDEVVMAIVSQEPNVTRIQRDIADFLKLELNEQNILARASRLHERLTQKGSKDKSKRILIILDDLWKKLDLKEVGIPFGDDHSGCKIVLTSRNRDVCVHMKADKIFSIPVLPENEAWILFKNSLLTTNLYPVAKEIVEQCGGLPIAITVIAMVLAEKEEDTWNYVLRQLKRSSLKGEYAAVHKVFKLSYDNLEHKEIKDVFLLCCLFPEDFDIPIEDLARYGMGRRFFEKVYKLHEARQNVHAHVQVLKNLNLLLDSEEEECVKMHDLVRDFGISIASEGEVFVRFYKGLKEWPMEDICEKCTSISMQCDEMDELPNELKYPNHLKLLQMWGSKSLPFKFLERLDEVMGELQVFALRRMCIPSLPGSVERLSNLRTLSLHCCQLNKDVSRIGNIVKLEILSFVGSDISELPKEIGKLSRLRLLDLTGCDNLKKIAPGVLSKLDPLEELYMRGTSICWAEEIRATVNNEEDEDEEVSDDEDKARDDADKAGDDEDEARDDGDEGTYASFAELKQLSNLVAIDINIPYMFLPVDLNLENLEKFKISVGIEKEDDKDIKEVYQNTLFLKADEIAPLRRLLKALCRKTEILGVAVKDIKNLCNEVERKDLSRLKILSLFSCDELVSVFDDGMNQSSSIHSSSSVLPTFGNLRTLGLVDCSKLKSIFSPSIARGLINLEILFVRECSGIEEIISKERGDHNQDEKKAVELLNLKELDLKDLPNLVSFCDQVLKLPQLKEVDLRSLPKLTSIYPEMKTSSSSDGHHVYASSSSSTNHPLFLQKVTLTSLKVLQVREMENMTTVFPENVIQQLQSLKEVEVWDCKSVEVVFDLQGSNLTEVHHQVFSQFQRMGLGRLPKLTSVWKLCPRVILDFQNLNKLSVLDCDSLRHLFTLSMAKTLTKLDFLMVYGCEILEAIVAVEEGEEDEKEFTTEEAILFPKLTALHLGNLPSLLTILPEPYSFNWSSLKQFTLDKEKSHLLRRPDQVSV
ncbi:hypothetical protein LguiB_004120 [Lonicera macranthoides]